MPDIVFCFGWSYLLRQDVLDVPKWGVVGYHPALLPQNRGRHPIIWALALGLARTGSTFFIMNGGADAGDVISQRVVEIHEVDDAASLYARLTVTASEQLVDLTSNLKSLLYSRIPQDHASANVWRKRSARDGEIDWRMSAAAIRNLVRALARPYPGAHCRWSGGEHKVWKVEIVGGAPSNLEPGQVMAVDGGSVVVKCGDGAVRLIKHEGSPRPHPREYLL